MQYTMMKQTRGSRLTDSQSYRKFNLNHGRASQRQAPGTNQRKKKRFTPVPALSLTHPRAVKEETIAVLRVATVECLPALHYSVDFIFLSFGIMGFIVELETIRIADKA